MPPLERLILDAWQRLKPQILGNPAGLTRRLARRDGRTFSRPPRAWCLAVRACDHRIGASNGRIDPDYATDPHDPDHPGRVVEHTVTLTAPLLRQLCCPVRLFSPGELWEDAARKLGTSHQGLTAKRISGALRTHHIKAVGGRGHPVPLVFNPRPLDPCNARDFAMPHPLWTGHEAVSARVPDELEQTITRVPIYAPTTFNYQYEEPPHPELAGPPELRRSQRLPPPAPDYAWYKWSTAGVFLGDDPRYWRKNPADPGTPPPPGAANKPKRKRTPKPSRASGSLLFRGWRWLCPKCNRKVRTLYLPAPPAQLLEIPLVSNSKSEARNPKQIQDRQKSQISQTAVSVISDQFEPSDLFRISDFEFRISTGFACWSCHRIRGFSSIAPNSWNDLVSYFSGGLLYGHEVPQPPDYRASARRKNRYTSQINRPSPRRQKLVELLLQGRSSRHIAAIMGLTQLDVCGRIWQLCRREGVPNRTALAKKFGSTADLEPNRNAQAHQRRRQVLDLLIRGLSAPEIAARLGIKVLFVWKDTHALCREHEVKGREALLAKHQTAQAATYSGD